MAARTADRKNKRIFQEAAKARHTTHWDFDYMTDAQIDAWMAARRRNETGTRRRVGVLIAIGTLFGMIGIGLLVVVWLGR